MLIFTFFSQSERATVSTYSGSTCQSTKLVGQQFFGVGCALSVLDSYYATADDAYSTSLSCEPRAASGGSSALTPPGPVSSTAATYALQR